MPKRTDITKILEVMDAAGLESPMTEEALQMHFGFDKDDFHQLFKPLEAEGLIRSLHPERTGGPGRYTITPAGHTLLHEARIARTTEEQARIAAKQTCILDSQSATLNKQASISAEQTRISKTGNRILFWTGMVVLLTGLTSAWNAVSDYSVAKNTAPLTAEVRLAVQTPDPFQFSAQDILQPRGDQPLGMKYNLCVYNVGQISTGPVHINVEPPFDTTTIFNQSIDPGKDMCITPRLLMEGCLNDGRRCDIDKLPHGNADLIFSVDCVKCTPRTRSEIHHICVWRESEQECA